MRCNSQIIWTSSGPDSTPLRKCSSEKIAWHRETEVDFSYEFDIFFRATESSFRTGYTLRKALTELPISYPAAHNSYNPISRQVSLIEFIAIIAMEAQS